MEVQSEQRQKEENLKTRFPARITVRQRQFLKFIRKGEHAFNVIYIAKEKQVQPMCKVKTNLVKNV